MTVTKTVCVNTWIIYRPSLDWLQMMCESLLQVHGILHPDPLMFAVSCLQYICKIFRKVEITGCSGFISQTFLNTCISYCILIQTGSRLSIIDEITNSLISYASYKFDIQFKIIFTCLLLFQTMNHISGIYNRLGIPLIKWER